MKKLLAILTLALFVGLAPPSHAIDEDAAVFIMHGIPGEDVGADPALPVDVSLEGVCTLENFTFGELAGPALLPAGTYAVAVSPASATDPCGNAPILEEDVVLEAGQAYVAVAHLTVDGSPTISLYEVDVDRPDPSDVRVIVLHLAEAPAVDVSARRPKPFIKVSTIPGLENGDQGEIILNPGSWRFRISPAGTTDAVYENKVILRNRTVYFVFAVGSVENGTFQVIIKHFRPRPKPMGGIFVVHGIPGEDLGLDPALPVDVSVNGMCILRGFEFGDIVGPATLMPATYTVELRPADAVNPCTGPPLLSAEIFVDRGENITVIAHLTADGTPTISKFNNDFSPTWWKRARVILHHTAWAPAVDVSFMRSWWDDNVKLCVSDLENGDQTAVELLPGNWEASISPAGMGMSVFETEATLRERTVYLVYPVGSMINNTFDVLIKAVGGNGDHDD